MNGLRARGASNGTAAGDTVADRAALFEDEKRRIIESCFTKKEPDGNCEIMVYCSSHAHFLLTLAQSLSPI